MLSLTQTIPTFTKFPTLNSSPIRTRKRLQILCVDTQNPKPISKPTRPRKTHIINSIVIASKVLPINENKKEDRETREQRENRGEGEVGWKKMVLLCGFGYWIQGFRCFPWLALNFHMGKNLNFEPSGLQLVQNAGNLPMVAKPIYGILSDALYIGGAHGIPYVSIGVLLQVLSWGPLASIPFVGDALPTLMAFVLLSNLGAAITEVAQDALVAEYGQKHKIIGLQSYTFMAIAVAGILGNSLGGLILRKAHPRFVLAIFTGLLLLQLIISLTTREESLGLLKPSNRQFGGRSISSSIKKQFSDLLVALRTENISHPLIWVVTSIAIVPMLTGSIFCYQTQVLNLDPSIIGMSKVVGHMVLLSLTVLYDRFWKKLPMRKLINTVQILYASSLLLDLVLVKQINLKVGISNDMFALCFSSLAEAIASFKNVPFFVLMASLCPRGCEASLTAFVASALTLSLIVSGFLGVGLASAVGVASGNYSKLPIGILVQCIAALLPLKWIDYVPVSEPSIEPVTEKETKRGRSRRNRKNRRIGRVVLNSIFTYRRQRDAQR